jgi:hypothetical protein
MQASCAPRVAAIMAAVCGTQRTASGLLARGEEDPEPGHWRNDSGNMKGGTARMAEFVRSAAKTPRRWPGDFRRRKSSIEPLLNAVGQRPWRASRRHRLRARGYAAGNGAAPEFLQFTKSNSPDR